MCLRASTLLLMRGLAHPCFRGKAVKRLCCSVHPWAYSHDLAHHRRRAHAPAVQRPGPRCRAGHRPAARGTPVHTGCACHLAAGFARPSRWRYCSRPDRPWDWHACAGHCEVVRPGRHRRAAPAARDAGPLLPAGAAAVGIPSVGRRQRLDHGLRATAKRWRTVSISVWSVTRSV